MNSVRRLARSLTDRSISLAVLTSTSLVFGLLVAYRAYAVGLLNQDLRYAIQVSDTTYAHDVESPALFDSSLYKSLPPSQFEGTRPTVVLILGDLNRPESRAALAKWRQWLDGLPEGQSRTLFVTTENTQPDPPPILSSLTSVATIRDVYRFSHTLGIDYVPTAVLFRTDRHVAAFASGVPTEATLRRCLQSLRDLPASERAFTWFRLDLPAYRLTQDATTAAVIALPH